MCDVRRASQAFFGRQLALDGVKSRGNSSPPLSDGNIIHGVIIDERGETLSKSHCDWPVSACLLSAGFAAPVYITMCAWK